MDVQIAARDIGLQRLEELVLVDKDLCVFKMMEIARVVDVQMGDDHIADVVRRNAQLRQTVQQ